MILRCMTFLVLSENLDVSLYTITLYLFTPVILFRFCPFHLYSYIISKPDLMYIDCVFITIRRSTHYGIANQHMIINSHYSNAVSFLGTYIEIRQFDFWADDNIRP